MPEQPAGVALRSGDAAEASLGCDPGRGASWKVDSEGADTDARGDREDLPGRWCRDGELGVAGGDVELLVGLAPARAPIRIQRWSVRRLAVTAGVLLGAAIAVSLVWANLTPVGLR